MARVRDAQRPNGTALNRCAIYTRKSSEEGLAQEFNSLDAQREACEACIRSQKSAGWMALPDMYDDGGISGGTLDRPALHRLLADIGAGHVDTVVVYKVDRLTRSLNDFAKIVEAFDAKGVSFVSVTQQFNTTTSMGRLTLNMLLSFAQFEREVTGERIRDKIAASKQKGMWMGGTVPLGYDIQDRKLVVNMVEADTVRHIFRRYADIKSVSRLKDDLDTAGIVSKARIDRLGQAAGGRPIARGALYLMLQNRIYRGEIVHKDKAYPGLHEAVIDEALWVEVQSALAENRVERVTRSKATAPSLLAGLVYDESGERLSPTHANKIQRGIGGTAGPTKTSRRYRYYVSQTLIKRGRSKASEVACRVPAADLENIVEDRICALLKDEAAVLNAVGGSTVASGKVMIEAAAHLARRWPTLPAATKRALLRALVGRIELRPEAVDIAIIPSALHQILQPHLDVRRLPTAADGSPLTVLSVPAKLRRIGGQSKLLIQGTQGPQPQRRTHRSLLRLVAQAQHFRDLVMANTTKRIQDLANEAQVSPSYFSRVLRLSFLAPGITTAIIQGRQPFELSAIKLMTAGRLAEMWSDQRRQLGFD